MLGGGEDVMAPGAWGVVRRAGVGLEPRRVIRG
jgi:hypothetical protein